jgi:hypothetical protein
MVAKHPCLSCGACCAFYRVSFYWAEADDYIAGTVPIHLTDNLSGFMRTMKGTSQKSPRCIALHGEIGDAVHCTIYAKRASVCREFESSFENGQPNERCDKARLGWGLLPLTPADWVPIQEPPLPLAA